MRLTSFTPDLDFRIISSHGFSSTRQKQDKLLGLVANGPPQVRRRTVVALTAFDGPEVEAAFAAARDDRNPMVREAAEMVIGIEVPELPPCLPLISLEGNLGRSE